MKIMLMLILSLSLLAEAPKLTSVLTPQEFAKLTADDANAGAHFANSIATEGNMIVVGSDGRGLHAGSAYVYEYDAQSGLYNQLAKLTASDVNDTDHFGCSVAISNDTVVVGSFWNDAPEEHSGAVYIFEKNGLWSDMTETFKLTASDAAADDAFGISVAISANTLVVGAYGDDDNGSLSGSVYIFEKGSSWDTATETKLLPSNGVSYNRFGSSIAIEGNTVAIGAPYDIGSGGLGSAYIFENNMGWSQSAKLEASDAVAGYNFGNSIAISGDTVVVGSYKDGEVGSEAGAAYIYEKGALWSDMTETLKLTASDGVAGDWFGKSVAISGETVLVGASYHNSRAGAMYVFTKPSSDWNGLIEQKKLTTSNAGPVAEFGGSVAVSEGIITIGAAFDDEFGNYAGAVFVFKDGPYINSVENRSDVVDFEATDLNGDTISFALYGGDDAAKFAMEMDTGLLSFITNPDYEAPDDADGDNLYRFILKLYDDFGETRFYPASVRIGDSVFEGKSPKALSFEEIQKLQSAIPVDNDYFGFSVDIEDNTAVVGVKGYNAGAGTAYIYEYNATLGQFEQIARLRASDDTAGNQFGYSIAISGDTVIIGSPYDDSNGSNAGSAYLFEKPSGGWQNATEDVKFVASDAGDNARFGYSVSISGDTVAIGSYGDSEYGTYAGAAYVYEKVSSWNQVAKLSASDATYSDYFGYSIAMSANVIVVGSVHDDDNASDSGSAYLFEKPLGGWQNAHESAKLTASDAKDDAVFGIDVAIDGDTVLIGSVMDSYDGYAYAGSAYVFEKPIQGWQSMHESAKLTPSDASSIGYFASAVAIEKSLIVIGNADKNSIYMYEKPATGWSDANETRILSGSDLNVTDRFGDAVAISGDTVIVGNRVDEIDGAGNAGSAYIFKAKNTTPVLAPIISYLLN